MFRTVATTVSNTRMAMLHWLAEWMAWSSSLLRRRMSWPRQLSRSKKDGTRCDSSSGDVATQSRDLECALPTTATITTTTDSSVTAKNSCGIATTTQHDRSDTTDYRSILLSDAPLLDVRAPVEYAKGAFPCSHNLPLMMDDERHKVGLFYAREGRAAALTLGHQLVRDETKAARLSAWADFAKTHSKDGFIYCFRGGLRSNTVRQWIEEDTGIRLPLIKGGYKAMRQFLLEELDSSLSPDRTNVIRICGSTGSGKTRVIDALTGVNFCAANADNTIVSAIDLEGLAKHRGSAFGECPEDDQKQPRQINFENLLSIALLKLLEGHDRRHKVRHAATDNVKPRATVFVEDEGLRVGSICLPPVLRDRMVIDSDIIMVEEPISERINLIIEDYIVDLGQRYEAIGKDAASSADAHRAYMLASLQKCERRLGQVRYKSLRNLINAGFDRQELDRTDVSGHRLWIERMLVEYYDPMYHHQLEQRSGGKVLFRGSRQDAIQFCHDYARQLYT